jgi:hypothetical protein
MSSTTDAPPAPRVSVLMTIYNAAPFLAKSIGSLLAQSYTDWELIAVENGSSDGSAAILADYAEPRIRAFMLETNIGRTPALRYAFAQARGEYIAVLDADDVAHPQRLVKQVTHLDAHPKVVLLGTWVNYIDEHDAIIGESTPPADSATLLNRLGGCNPIVHSSAMYRADAAQAVGGYPPDMPYSQDFGLWLELMAHGAPALLAERLCSFRIQSRSLTQSGRYGSVVAYDQLRSLLKAREQLALDAEGRRTNREEVAIARLRYAVALMRCGRLLAGVGAAARAFILDPIRLLNNRITRSLFF